MEYTSKGVRQSITRSTIKEENLYSTSKKDAYRYSEARLFLIKRIDETKYIPIISDRKSTTLLEDPLPTLETAKKNCIATKHSRSASFC